MTLQELITLAQQNAATRADLARQITAATTRIAELITASATLTTIRDTGMDELGTATTNTTEELNFTLADVLTDTQAAIDARARLITGLAEVMDEWELTLAAYIRAQQSAIVRAKSTHY